eukprot:CAMPEP_0194323110 /NCGR_PEP_ID=MMETSP0171-20130528/24026_1 /TAXON_ID=218684 /ORGANISM="Corethron pennatum, Strain L29A3" /LENGTH=79 /DNA_ID=CAMNT_0039081619 /DNA_START=8 /DNA_END=244 /DNA_ORIENTATION=-
MTRVSAYYIKDSLVTPKQEMSGVAIFGFSLFIGVILLVVIYQIYFVKDSKSPETVINQEGVSSYQGGVPSLPGAEGIVK